MNFFPVIELVDRYAIARLKFEKTRANQEELAYYTEALKQFDTKEIQQQLIELLEIHGQIWHLESQLKSGRESELPLEEIGRRAIEIRNLNNQRIKLKNAMAEKLGCTVREIKQDHISQ